MSALPLKADMLSVSIDVRLVPQADIAPAFSLADKAQELKGLIAGIFPGAGPLAVGPRGPAVWNS